MTLWIKFFLGLLALALVVVVGLLLPRRKRPPALRTQQPVQDDRILYVLLWCASLSILGYIAFAFWKR